MKLTRTTRNAGWLVVAGLLGAALIAPAGAAAASVPPIFHEGNVTGCPAGFTAIVIDGPGENASITGGSGTAGGVTVAITYGNGQTTIDFVATGGVVNVAYVKGGDNYNEYNYGAAGTTSDTGLVSPLNNGGQVPRVSHSVFCVTKSTTTTTTTVPSTTTTTTTTVPSTTTTTTTSVVESETTSSQATSTTTTVSGTVGGETGKPTPPSTDTVAFSSTSSTTGSGWSLILIAMAGLLAGALLLTPAAAARKR